MVTKADLRERVDPRGRAYYWIGALKNNIKPRPGSDLAEVAAGGISVTPVHLENSWDRAMLPRVWQRIWEENIELQQ